MKIKPSDFEVLKARVAPMDTPERRAFYIAENLGVKRYRWDCMWRSKIRIGDGVGTQGDLNLYAYMNDDHIDTALRAIVPDLITGVPQ